MYIAEIDASVSKNIVIPNVMFLLSYMILLSNTVVHICTYIPETGSNEPGSADGREIALFATSLFSLWSQKQHNVVELPPCCTTKWLAS